MRHRGRMTSLKGGNVVHVVGGQHYKVIWGVSCILRRWRPCRSSDKSLYFCNQVHTKLWVSTHVQFQAQTLPHSIYCLKMAQLQQIQAETWGNVTWEDVMMDIREWARLWNRADYEVAQRRKAKESHPCWTQAFQIHTQCHIKCRGTTSNWNNAFLGAQIMKDSMKDMSKFHQNVDNNTPSTDKILEALSKVDKLQQLHPQIYALKFFLLLFLILTRDSPAIPFSGTTYLQCELEFRRRT